MGDTRTGSGVGNPTRRVPGPRHRWTRLSPRRRQLGTPARQPDDRLRRAGNARHTRPSRASASSQPSVPVYGSTGSKAAPGPLPDGRCIRDSPGLRGGGFDHLLIRSEHGTERGGDVPGVDHRVQQLKPHRDGDREPLVRTDLRELDQAVQRRGRERGAQAIGRRQPGVLQAAGAESPGARTPRAGRHRIRRRRRNRGSVRSCGEAACSGPSPRTAWNERDPPGGSPASTWPAWSSARRAAAGSPERPASSDRPPHLDLLPRLPSDGRDEQPPPGYPAAAPRCTRSAVETVVPVGHSWDVAMSGVDPVDRRSCNGREAGAATMRRR